MTYSRLVVPKFFMDNCNWQASLGLSRDSMITIDADEIQLNSGYTKYQLFNMNPLDYVTFDTGTASDDVLIAIDMGVSGISTTSLAIMNHNLDTAEGKFEIRHHTSAITTPATGTVVDSIAAVFNAGTVGSGVSTPAGDGDTIVSFTASTDRYWAIVFSDVATWTATDLQVGEIMLGAHYTMPHSPDFPIGKPVAYDGVNVRESYGGKRFGFARWLAPSSGDYSPFRSNSRETTASGRQAYDFSYSYVEDTNIFPSDRATLYGSSNFLGDVVNKAGGSLLPFIFLCDSTSTTEGDFMYARFDQPTFSPTTPSWTVETFSARIVQEF